MAGCISEGVCSLEEESDNLEQQRNEVEMLQSIFDQEISILKENTEYLVCKSLTVYDAYFLI